MGWKKKEKELTLEQALQLAKKDLAPFWLGSSPLFTAFEQDGAVKLFPLDEKLFRGRWIFFFLDATSFTFEETITIIENYRGQYESLGVQFLCIFQPPYQPLADPKTLELLLEETNLRRPWVIDHDGFIHKVYEVGRLPAAIFSEDRKVLVRSDSLETLPQFENELQRLLRKDDPGLPLLEPFSTSNILVRDKFRIEFGKKKSDMPLVRQKEVDDNFIPADDLVYLVGDWDKNEDEMMPSSPNAKIIFAIKNSSALSVFCSAAGTASDRSRVSVELNDAPVFDSASGKDLVTDETGKTVLKILEPKNHLVLSGLSKERHVVQLEFLNPEKVKTKVYGIQISD